MAQDSFLHERLYRGEEVIKKFESHRITVCGAGALGANIVESLCRQGFRSIVVIDRDRIEPHNVNTQPYGLRETGQSKVQVLAANIFRSLKIQIATLFEELSERNIDRSLQNAQLIVDTFDNSVSRKLVGEWCAGRKIPCLHAGMSDDGYGEVIWNENYTIPEDRGRDICDYPLARNLALFVSAIGSEVIIRHISTGTRESYTFTLEDMKILPR